MPYPQTCKSTKVPPSLKLAKLLTPFIASIDLQHIESYSLAQRSALSNRHIISLLDSKARRNVGGKVLVTFLVPIIFLDVVEVVTTKYALALCPNTLYLGPYRMMMVRCILAETTMPERMRPRMEIWPVKGHFLSTKRISNLYRPVLGLAVSRGNIPM